MDVAILDDYQAVAEQMADWSQLPPGINVRFFHDHLADEDELVERLKSFQVVNPASTGSTVVTAVADEDLRHQTSH